MIGMCLLYINIRILSSNAHFSTQVWHTSAHTNTDLEMMEDQSMKHFSKVMALALVLGAITACAYGCVGPESNDSGVNENADTTATTTQKPTTQAPTTEPTTTEGAMGSIAGDVSDALTDGMTTQGTTEATTTAPARTRGRAGK